MNVFAMMKRRTAIFQWLTKRIAPPPPRAIDISNFWRGPATDAEAFDIMSGVKKLGYAGVMVGTFDVAIATQQSNAAMMSGLWTDVFAYLLFDGDDANRIKRAAAVPHSGLCWIDCEEVGTLNPDVNTLRNADVVAKIVAAVDLAWSLGLRPAIYTRRLWWTAYTGDSKLWSAYPLWVSDPDGIAVLDAAYWTRNAFAGVAMPTWKQYAFNQPIAGINVDLNVGAS